MKPSAFEASSKAAARRGYCVLGALERALVGDTKRAAECFVMAAESAEDNLEVLRESGAALRSFPTRCHIAARMHIRALDLDPKDDCSRRELACSLNDLGTFLKANGPGCVTEDCARACLEAVDSCLGGTKAARTPPSACSWSRLTRSASASPRRATPARCTSGCTTPPLPERLLRSGVVQFGRPRRREA